MRKGLTIAVSGKGGVGKTNFSALLVRSLARRGSVLALDADPDSNLPQALGINIQGTIGDIREDILNAPARSEVAQHKAEHLKMALHELVEETPDFDLAVMGRPEGPGCYCAVNYVLRQVIDSRAESYDFTVIDCEPGLEHLSRRTTRDVDILVVVTDPTKNGILTAKRVQDLARELFVDFGQVQVVANKITPQTRPLVEKMAQEEGLEVVGYIPYDPLVAEYDALGKPVWGLPPQSPFSQGVEKIAETILAPART